MAETQPDVTIDPGADVIGTDDNKLGTVAYVVVRPHDLHVTDLVVSTGELLGRDVVVSAGDIQRIENGKVYVDLDKKRLETLPDYVEIKYQRPPIDWVPPAGYFYPANAMLWPSTEPVTTSEAAGAEVTVNTPPGTVGIHEGMEIESQDGHKVGSVDSLEADPSTGDIVAFVVKEGFIFHHDVRFPVEDVAQVAEDRITLKKTKDQIESETGTA